MRICRHDDLKRNKGKKNPNVDRSNDSKCFVMLIKTDEKISKHIHLQRTKRYEDDEEQIKRKVEGLDKCVLILLLTSSSFKDSLITSTNQFCLNTIKVHLCPSRFRTFSTNKTKRDEIFKRIFFRYFNREKKLLE